MASSAYLAKVLRSTVPLCQQRPLDDKPVRDEVQKPSSERERFNPAEALYENNDWSIDAHQMEAKGDQDERDACSYTS